MTDIPNGNHSVARWAGLTTFFTNVAAINLLGLLGGEDDQAGRVGFAFISALAVAASVYARQRWYDAKEEKMNRQGSQNAKTSQANQE